MSTVSVTDARAALPALINEVQRGDEVAITRHGQVVAVLVNPASPRARRTGEAFDDARRLHEMLAMPASGVLPPAGLSAQRAEDLGAAIRLDRDAG